MIKNYLQYINEHHNLFRNNFKKGDFVVCVDNSFHEKNLKLNDIYEIEENSYEGDQIKFVNKYHFWYASRFRLATPEEITAKKYNL